MAEEAHISPQQEAPPSWARYGPRMKIDVRHNPSFAAARVTLEGGEELRAESGAMMATSTGVAGKASTQGGVLKGLKRSVLGGQSLFVTTYTAPSGAGWVDLADYLPGDVVLSEVTAGA